MIKLQSMDDLRKLADSKLSLLIKSYITDYFIDVLNRNKSIDICDMGAFYVLESKGDTLMYKDIGLSKPINKSLPEFTDLITIKDSENEAKLLHSCFVLTNSYAVSVFAEKGLYSKDVEYYLLQDCGYLTINLKKECL